MRQKLKETFRLVKVISDYLYSYSLIAIPVIVNILTINLDLKPDESTNSVLLVLPKGLGKTTLLHHILQKSNPEWIPELPEKFFESQILQEPDDKFDRKVWVQDDLITTFKGTSTKQREQLMGFFNTFLTKGEYSRKGLKKKGRIVCVFGLAKEHYKDYGKQMFQETFTDRFIPIRYSFDEKTKQHILRLRAENENRNLPVLKLPFKQNPVGVELPKELNQEVIRLALELDSKGVMTACRAQNHIMNFLKANADLNGRGRVEEEDLRLFKLTMPLYLGANSDHVDVKVRETILEHSIKEETVTGVKVKNEVSGKLGCSNRRVEQVLQSLRDSNTVCYKKSSSEYEYWL